MSAVGHVLFLCHVWHTRKDRDTGVSEAEFVGGNLLTVAEVASAMRVSNMTVYRLIKSGDLPAVRIGKNFRIREADVRRYFADRAVRVGDA